MDGLVVWANDRQYFDVITSVVFHKFKALRDARLELKPFNLILGPNGSGKTSLIQALLRLRDSAKSFDRAGLALPKDSKNVAEITFQFEAPNEGAVARLTCADELDCDVIDISGNRSAEAAKFEQVISGIRAFWLDHHAIAGSCDAGDTLELASNGGNLAAVMAALQSKHADIFTQLEAEFVRMMPEFEAIKFQRPASTTMQLALQLRGVQKVVSADNISQGTLYVIAFMFLAFHPQPPTVLCIEEIDRGIHPRMLREVRDLLYRLSYPTDIEAGRPPVQVIATTHSPYLLDLFKTHPEEIIISQKSGNTAHFERLSDREDLAELMAEGSLGDLWFSGILGGVPEE